MKNKQLIVKTVIILAVLSFAMLKIIKHGSDFEVFLNAGHKLALYKNIYRPPFIRGLNYFYSPFFALLLLPLSHMPYIVVQFVWLLCTTFFFYRSWVLTTSNLDLNLLSKREINVLVFSTIFLMTRVALEHYTYAQVNVLMLWITLESLCFFKNKQYLHGGLLLAFGCTTKLLPLLFLPYVLYRKEFKAFLFTVFFCILFLLAPAVFIGVGYNNFLLHEWWLVINPNNKQFIIEPNIDVYSLISLVLAFLTKAQDQTLKRNFLELSLKQALFITKMVQAFFAIAALYFLHSWPFKAARGKIHVIWECSYLFLVTPLLFPHQRQYSFVYILPAVIYLVYYLIIAYKVQYKRRHILVTLFVINTLIFNPLITIDVFSVYACSILKNFKVLSFATIGLCVFLAACTAKKLEDRCLQLYGASR